MKESTLSVVSKCIILNIVQSVVIESLRKDSPKKAIHFVFFCQLRHQVLDVTKTSESRQIAMEVELVSRQKTITELERVLEAHQLKARIECNALKDLHCQTLKVSPQGSN